VVAVVVVVVQLKMLIVLVVVVVVAVVVVRQSPCALAPRHAVRLLALLAPGCGNSR